MGVGGGMRDRASALRALGILMGLMGLGWAAGALLGGAPLSWGIEPRSWGGLLPGMAAAPFLHVSFGHLAGNLWALAIFGGLIALLEGERRFWRATAAGILGGGR